MISFRTTCLLSVFLFFSSALFAQNRKLDQLEQLYAQQHYKLVYNKSKKLLDSPDYDFTVVPKLYKCMSLFQLAKNEYWLKRNPDALTEAEKLFIEVKSSNEGGKVMDAHMNEISELKDDLYAWGQSVEGDGNKNTAAQLEQILVSLFSKIPSATKNDPKLPAKTEPVGNDERSKIIAFAEKSIGIPYKWGGMTSSGFDCSGFTTHVMKEFRVSLPRRAVDQQKASIKIKQKDAQKGDLVFFNNGGGISHVGIITSDKGKPLTMIHASSSQGITITNLEKSTYWMKRLDSFGTFVK
jgi:peptidoglycan DL-endopeptidase CwlO